MLHSKVRLAVLAGCAAGMLAIAGCGAREPVETPPAMTAPGYDAATPDLTGAPPVADTSSAAEASPADGLLGGPLEAAPPPPVASGDPALTTWRRPDGTLVTAMSPIANPETTTRRSIRHAPRTVAAPPHRANAALAPVARPVARPLPVAKPAPKPVAVAPAPAPLKPVVATGPAAALAKPPVVAPIAPALVQAPVKTEAGKPRTRLQNLQATVAPEATKGAVLASGESLAQGKEAQVTLSLPATLGDLIKTEAARLGLTQAAKKTSAYADLRGEGYEITPNGRQTAVVKTGEPATFAWQVKPTPAAKGPLKTEFGVKLDGVKPAQGFSLGTIAKRIAPIQEAVKANTHGFQFAMPNLDRYETVDLPGVGKIPGKSILGGLLLLLALLILVVISRNASAATARPERHRKARAPSDHGYNAMDFDAPKAAEANPTVGPHGAPAHKEYAPFDAPLDQDRGAPPAADPGQGGRGHDARKELEPIH